MEKEINQIEATRQGKGDLSVMISLQGSPEETQIIMKDVVIKVNDAINASGIVKVNNGFWLCLQEMVNDELNERTKT